MSSPRIKPDSPLALVLRSREELDLFTGALEGQKFTNLTPFTSAEEALEAAKRKLFAAFVTRMELADMSGAVLIQKLRATGNYGDEPHLFLCDKVDTGTLNIIYELDLAYVLTKPFNFDRIETKFGYMVSSENKLPPFEVDYRAARGALVGGLIDMAADLAGKLLAAFPKVEKVHVLLGDVAAARGDLAGARVLYEKALAISPAFGPAASKLAYSYMNEKNFTKAAELLNVIATASPHSIRVLESAGIANIETGQFDKANEHLARLKVVDKTNRVAVGLRATAALRQGNYVAMVEEIKGSRNESEAIVYVNEEGIKLAHAHQLDKALLLYHEALRQFGKSPFAYAIHLNAGLAYYRLEKADEAIHHGMEALRIKPGFEKAEILLRKVKAAPFFSHPRKGG